MKFDEIMLTNGFWKDMYDRNANVSIYAVQNRFEETNRFEALRFTHKEKPEIPLHIFYDSDVAKWIEAVAYLLKVDREKYAELEEFCDELIDSMEKHQAENGYLNSYFQQIEPDKIYQDRTNHELYCIGHLAEAAVAYAEGTGKEKFLKVIERALDYVNQVFVVEQSAPYLTCGHQEVKLGLLKMYDYTGDKKYLDMVKFFIDMRGNNEKDKGKCYPFTNDYYWQDNAPARELVEADGHAVRACYYYTAMADFAVKTNDEALKNACKHLYESMVEKKMYITGGIGSTKIGEAFATEYTLPNSTAYSESCAAISLIFFCYNMLKIEHNAKYSDTIEKILYNGFLSSTSLDGKSFFYENPLEINLAERDVETAIPSSHRQQFPITQRVEVFDCSCCPPNINRVMASIAQYAYFEEKDGLYIEQYMPSKIAKYGVEVATEYPLKDTIKVTGKGYPFSKIAIRIPIWCENYSFNKAVKIENGYAVFDVESDFEIIATYPQTVKFTYANTKVFHNVGKVALTYGPIVYCLEGIDNGGTLTNVFVNTDSVVIKEKAHFHPLYNFVCDGVRATSSEGLYSTRKPKKEEVKLTFIPYFTFANRGEQNMQVWVNEK